MPALTALMAADAGDDAAMEAICSELRSHKVTMTDLVSGREGGKRGCLA